MHAFIILMSQLLELSKQIVAFLYQFAQVPLQIRLFHTVCALLVQLLVDEPLHLLDLLSCVVVFFLELSQSVESLLEIALSHPLPVRISFTLLVVQFELLEERSSLVLCLFEFLPYLVVPVSLISQVVLHVAIHFVYVVFPVDHSLQVLLLLGSDLMLLGQVVLVSVDSIQLLKDEIQPPHQARVIVLQIRYVVLQVSRLAFEDVFGGRPLSISGRPEGFIAAWLTAWPSYALRRELRLLHVSISPLVPSQGLFAEHVLILPLLQSQGRRGLPM